MRQRKTATRADRVAMRDWIGERTQTQAGIALGSTQGFLSAWLLGNRELSAKTMKRWSKRTGIPVETFALAKVAA